MFLYISSFEELDKAPGIEKKIRGQVKFINDIIDKGVLIYAKNGKIFCEEINNLKCKTKKIIFSALSADSMKLLYYFKVYNYLQKFDLMSKEKTIKLAYFRFSTIDFFILMILNILKKYKWRIILEIPTYSFKNEWKKAKLKGLYKLFHYYLLGVLFFKKVDLIVCIGAKPKIDIILKGYFDKMIVINNGIDLDEIRMLKININEYKKEINLIGIANVAYWHGYDRVIQGLANFYKNTFNKDLVYFHIVGEGECINNLKNLVKYLKLDNFVKFYGLKANYELDLLISKCDIAVGSLGLHRIGGGNPLKHREYCARGIPFIYAGDDPGFYNGFPYALKVKSDDSPISIEDVIDFYKKIKSKYPNYNIEMREYAKNNFDWKIIMEKLIYRVL